jgi:hypothetical protein
MRCHSSAQVPEGDDGDFVLESQCCFMVGCWNFAIFYGHTVIMEIRKFIDWIELSSLGGELLQWRAPLQQVLLAAKLGPGLWAGSVTLLGCQGAGSWNILCRNDEKESGL